MQTGEFRIFHETRDSFLAPRIVSIDSQSDPLKMVKVLVEGLAGDQPTGVWLNPLRGMPAIPRLSSYDLAYLDGEGRIVSSRELAPTDPFPRHLSGAASALILPWHTLSSAKVQTGDRVVLRSVEVEPAARPDHPIPSSAPSAPLPPSAPLSLDPATIQRAVPSQILDPVPAVQPPSRFGILRAISFLRVNVSISITLHAATPPASSSAHGLSSPRQPIPRHPSPAAQSRGQSASRNLHSSRPSFSSVWTSVALTTASWDRLWCNFKARDFRSAGAVRRAPRIIEEC